MSAACAASNAVGDAAGTVDPNAIDPRVANGWRVVRAAECARCHGRDYTGLAAPSIVAYASTQSREAFVRMVLDGDPTRGMPGYRDNTLVADNVDDIYRYFSARSTGEVGADFRPIAAPDKR